MLTHIHITASSIMDYRSGKKTEWHQCLLNVDTRSEQKGSWEGSCAAADRKPFQHERLSVEFTEKPCLWLRLTATLCNRWVKGKKGSGRRKLRGWVRALTFAQLGEDEELSLSGVWLLLADGGSRAELNCVGMTRQLFLWGRQVKDHTARTSNCHVEPGLRSVIPLPWKSPVFLFSEVVGFTSAFST